MHKQQEYHHVFKNSISTYFKPQKNENSNIAYTITTLYIFNNADAATKAYHHLANTIASNLNATFQFDKTTTPYMLQSAEILLYEIYNKPLANWALELELCDRGQIMNMQYF